MFDMITKGFYLSKITNDVLRWILPCTFIKDVNSDFMFSQTANYSKLSQNLNLNIVQSWPLTPEPVILLL